MQIRSEIAWESRARPLINIHLHTHVTNIIQSYTHACKLAFDYQTGKSAQRLREIRGRGRQAIRPYFLGRFSEEVQLQHPGAVVSVLMLVANCTSPEGMCVCMCFSVCAWMCVCACCFFRKATASNAVVLMPMHTAGKQCLNLCDAFLLSCCVSLI